VFFLRAAPTTMTMPDTVKVPMWGFALDLDNNFATVDGTVTVPGPLLTVPDGDNQLVVNVLNKLSEPISFIVHGQYTDMSPVTFQDPQGRARVRSFNHETAPGAVGTYTYTNLRPGTYLYQSGSHVQVQVPMGLYGMVAKDTAPSQAYPYSGAVYNAQVPVIYSEVDPELNNAVASRRFGTAAFPSNVDYLPRYFLLNGSAEANVLDYTATAGETVLLRMVNAGSVDRAPMLANGTMDVIAEDGNPYPYTDTGAQAYLPPAKTKDAIVEGTALATAGLRIVVTDRRGLSSDFIPPPAAPRRRVAAGGGGGGGGCFLDSLAH